MKLALAFLLIFLTSCIPVSDFGPYWDKATVDGRLLGNWKRIADSGGQGIELGYPIGSVLTIADHGGMHRLTFTDPAGKPSGDPIYPVKTLTAGNYHYLLIGGPREGMLLRYAIAGRRLKFCGQFGPAMLEYVRSCYPLAKNVMKNDGEGEYAVVGKLDAETLAILSNIPDKDIMDPYAVSEGPWACYAEYEKAL